MRILFTLTALAVLSLVSINAVEAGKPVVSPNKPIVSPSNGNGNTIKPIVSPNNGNKPNPDHGNKVDKGEKKPNHEQHKPVFDKGYKSYDKGYKNWSSYCYWSKFGCNCFYCPTADCWYYWYAPAGCYYPVTYIEVYPPVVEVQVHTTVVVTLPIVTPAP